MSVACPASRRDGRRRLRLRKRKSSNFKLETSNCESENLQTWNCESEKLQTWVFKLETAKVRYLKPQTWNLKPQTTKVKIFKLESSKLNLESCLKVVKHWGCWILRIVKVESCWILKVECWKLSKLKVLNIESLLICCLLTSFQRRSYCTQSDIKRIKRSEELWKVIPKEILRVRVFYSSW